MALGCTGSVTGTDPVDNDGGDPTVDAGGASDPDAAGACPPTLAERLTVTPLVGVTGSGELFAAPTPGGGAVIAWRDAELALTEVDGAGARVGSDVAVAGTVIYGLAVHDDAWAIMFARGADELVLWSVDSTGGERFETRLLGAVDHDVTNNEWFGTGIRAGRLAWTGSQWAAYYTVQRLWPDGIAHYGDQLQLVEDSGALGAQMWGWGCSHSMEIRLAHNGTALGPVCVSDCYPVPGGVHFSHTTFIYSDNAGNCSGGYGDHLGGVVPVSGAFWVAFSSSDDRPAHDAAIVRVTDAREVGAITWLTDGGNISDLHIGAYGDRILAGWRQSGQSMFQLADAAGTPLGSPETLASAGIDNSSDLFAFANGDVGWVTRAGGAVSLARLRLCD